MTNEKVRGFESRSRQDYYKNNNNNNNNNNNKRETVVLTTNPHLKTGVDSTPETCEKHFRQWTPFNKFMLETTVVS